MMGKNRDRQKSRFVFLFVAALAFASCSSERDDQTSTSGISTAGGFESYCHGCHGSADTPAPPRDASGNTATTATGVGAHQSHITEGAIAAAIPCEACHIVPANADHANEHPTKITFGSLAKTGSLSPSWNGTTCSNTYCHGASLTAGTNTSPNWTRVDGTEVACGTCHGLPPNDGTHDPSWVNDCHLCHSATIAGPDPHVITNKAKHINGRTDFD